MQLNLIDLLQWRSAANRLRTIKQNTARQCIGVLSTVCDFHKHIKHNFFVSCFSPHVASLSREEKQFS